MLVVPLFEWSFSHADVTLFLVAICNYVCFVHYAISELWSCLLIAFGVRLVSSEFSYMFVQCTFRGSFCKETCKWRYVCQLHLFCPSFTFSKV